jgi:hypothetical protein
MINLLGPEPRSTYHETCVKRVRKYLEKKCGQAGLEEKLVHGHITDAFGYNKKSKIIYLCEIKVRRSDLRRAPNSIYETALRFKEKRKDYKTVVPVIAVPARLEEFLIKQDNWKPLCLMCKNLGIAVWVIEQSTIREVLSPKIKKTVKAKSSRASTAKEKITRTKKIAHKTGTSKTRKPKTTKKKTTRPESTSLKKRVVKSSRAKTPKTQSAKRKTSRVKVAKTKPARKKS